MTRTEALAKVESIRDEALAVTGSRTVEHGTKPGYRYGKVTLEPEDAVALNWVVSALKNTAVAWPIEYMSSEL